MFLIDTHEPPEIVNLLFSAIKEAEFSDLNLKGYADYQWLSKETGLKRQWERKTWKDLFRALDDVEFQLFREIQAHGDVETGLLVEGLVRPHPRDPQGVILMNAAKNGHFYDNRVLYGNYHKVRSWLHQVAQYIEVQYTFSVEDSAIALASWYDNDQKDQHTTFHRHMKKINFTPNVQVSRLLGLAHNDTNIGVDKAEKLIAHFGTAYGVASAKPEDIAKIDGISLAGAKNFLRKIGRPDVV